MNNWIRITLDNLPSMGQPVIVGWEKNPFYKDGGPEICKHMVSIEDFGEGWLWADALTGDAMEWDDDELPTHYMNISMPGAE